MNKDTLRRHVPSMTFLMVTIAISLSVAAAVIFSGAYNVAADEPHTAAVFQLLDSVRERSIAVRARDISPPADLSSPKRIAIGAGLYAEMCSGCHLGPGVERSELSQGLYPRAPELARPQNMTAAEQFWIIKHGVKMSAMPAWGKTHPDQLMWDMVAFVREMPGMSSAQYRTLVASTPADHDKMMGKGSEDHDGHMH